MAKGIYGSTDNIHIECQDEVLYLNKLHSIVKNYGCPNYKGTREPVLSGLNIKAWRQVLQGYDIANLSEYFELGFLLSVDYSLFEFKKFDKNHLSALQIPEGG